MRRAPLAVAPAVGRAPVARVAPRPAGRGAWPALAAALLGGSCCAHAAVYRSVDAEGLTVFSDVPRGPAAVIVQPSLPSAYAARQPPQPAAAVAPAPVEAPSYADARLLSPAEGEAVRANGGAVTVRGVVSPPLAAGHRAVLFLDGSVAAEAGASPTGALLFALEDVARGRREARIDVVDGSGRTLLAGTPSAFQVLRVALGRRPVARP